MEFVEGESLSAVLARRKRLTEAEATAVMADVARALAEPTAAASSTVT